MTETTPQTRYLVRADVDRHKPFDSVMFSAKVIRGLVNDADRLARAEELLSKARNQIDNPNPLSTLDERIDDFLSENQQ